MDLPLPAAPMEAQPVDAVPRGPSWQYEPKWDGFRCLVSRDGAAVALRSKSGQPLERYFPDLVTALGALAPRRFGLDGEIVAPVGDRLSFEDLQLRLHPAASRVRMLAAAHPALLIVFDLLVDEHGRALDTLPLVERRARLERFAARHFAGHAAIRLSPATTDLAVARRWFRDRSGDLDGIIAKRLDLPYDAGGRQAMQKVKHERTADCVVGGFRYASGAREVGSLLLGLYDDHGLLHHVGFTATIKRVDRPALTARLERLIAPPGFTGNAPGGPSRWSTERSTAWQPLRPKLVVEVRYDHVTGGRFRHGTSLVRWRPDKAPRQCTVDQLGATSGSALRLLDRRRQPAPSPDPA
jgi:ATP-dependent DNA ligase